MPRLKQPECKIKNDTLNALVKYYLCLNGMTVSGLSVKMQMSESNLYEKRKHPQKFTLAQLRRLIKVLGLTPEQILSIL